MIRKMFAVAVLTVVSNAASAQTALYPSLVQAGLTAFPALGAGVPSALAFPALTLVGLGFASYSPATATLFNAASEYAPLVVGPVNSAVPLPVIGELYGN